MPRLHTTSERTRAVLTWPPPPHVQRRPGRRCHDSPPYTAWRV